MGLVQSPALVYVWGVPGESNRPPGTVAMYVKSLLDQPLTAYADGCSECDDNAKRADLNDKKR
jgi:hypothetical protein